MEIEEKSEEESRPELAKRPKRWMLITSLFVIVCLGGLFRFRQEKNPLKLWVPSDSDFIRDTEWLMSAFREGEKIESLIFTADDVLEPEALYRLNEITKRIFSAQTDKAPRIAWTDVCFKVPIVTGIPMPQSRTKRQSNNVTTFDPVALGRLLMSNQKPGFDAGVHVPSKLYCQILNSLPSGCLFFSIMDIWEFNSTLIRSLTKDQIVEQFNAASTSPTLGHPINFSELLGGATRDKRGRIVAAKAVQTRWVLYVNFTAINMDDTGNDAGTADWTTRDVYEWEGVFLRELAEAKFELSQLDNYHYYHSNNNSNNQISGNNVYSMYYEASRSFGDISSDSIFHDIDKLVLGIVVMSFYVMVILSRFNWVELRFWLTLVAMFCIAGAFVVAIGLCSLAGIPYGPVHTSLPFMLMGLGVDDTFVMMAAWEEINSQPRYLSRPLTERVALALSHAGAAISVTSLTDVVAFVIGASTNKRNGLLPCTSHPDFGSPTKKPRESISWKIIDAIYINVVLTKPGKFAIIVLTACFATFGTIGSTRLEQWFDPVWFLPKDSYLSEYIIVREHEFPRIGFEANVFVSDVDFAYKFPKILNLSRTMENSSFTESVKNWPVDFLHFVDANFNVDIENVTLPDSLFRDYLSKFLFGRAGGKYRRNFRFAGNLTCGQPTPPLLTASLDFNFARFTTPYEWIPGMDEAKSTVARAGLDDAGGFATVWSEVFASWVTDKVISQEVARNLVLALVCVMGMTAFLLAEPQTCFWILTCVLLTLLDVCGFMYYWGMTIDVVSCIGLELAVGLCVDYAAHVAHAFLNVPGVNRHARALIAVRHIGSAVLFGAGSTLLALSLLSFSRAYVFRTFFKIFLLVIAFGLWHGLLLLPVVLSTVGPRSLRSDGVGCGRSDGGTNKRHTEEKEEVMDAVAVPLNK